MKENYAYIHSLWIMIITAQYNSSLWIIPFFKIVSFHVSNYFLILYKTKVITNSILEKKFKKILLSYLSLFKIFSSSR